MSAFVLPAPHALRPFCRTCGKHRLSAADVDGLCLFCRFPARVVKVAYKLCFDCMSEPRASNSSYCRECCNERSRRTRARRGRQ